VPQLRANKRGGIGLLIGWHFLKALEVDSFSGTAPIESARLRHSEQWPSRLTFPRWRDKDYCGNKAAMRYPKGSPKRTVEERKGKQGRGPLVRINQGG
jgi:hypothetical protein